MKIYCKVEAYYKVTPTKIKDCWTEIYELSDCNTFREQGYEVKYVISIIAVGDGSEEVLKSYEFVKTGRSTRRNISVLNNVFQYDEITDEIVCLNKYINI